MPAAIRLLLVDKDTLLLDTLEVLFEDHGYSTSAATTLPEAIAQLDGDSFDLVISHVLDTAPLTTLTMTQALRHHASPTPTGLLTGWDLLANTPGLDDFAFVVKKPFEVIRFLARVDETLALPLDEQALYRSYLIQRFFVALEQQNWEALAEICHPDMRLMVQPSGHVIAGRDAYFAYAGNLLTHAYHGTHFTQNLCFPFPNGITVRFSSQLQNAQNHTEYADGGTVFRFLGDQIVFVGVDDPEA